MNTDREAPIYERESQQIVGTAIEVFNGIGHGFHEKPYENALVIEFGLRGISCQQQMQFDILYKNVKVGSYIPDLIVYDEVVIDTKVIEAITDREIGQMLNYLIISGLRLGYILNFKHPKLKNFLKGFFDGFADKTRIIVTGSSRLDIYRRGGDSLMGRYFLYRMHPFSVGEIARTTIGEEPIAAAAPISEEDWSALWQFGGFPEPFLNRNIRFSNRWRSLRMQQLAKEDLREMTQVQELGSMEVLLQILAERSGQDNVRKVSQKEKVVPFRRRSGRQLVFED